MRRRPRFARPISVVHGCGGAAGVLAAVLILAVLACAGRTGVRASPRAPDAAPMVPWQRDTVATARFIFVGDSGTGDDRASGIAAQIRHQAEAGPVSHVFLLGDNVYDFRDAQSIADKFLNVYRAVSSLGVRIHAALGNHDLDDCTDSGLRPVPRGESAYRVSPRCSVRSQMRTPEFGYVDGFRYYSVAIAGGHPGDPRPEEPPLVEVFVLDSNTLGRMQTKLARGTDDPQLRWLAETLRRSTARWKVVAMHHPAYAPVRCRWFRFICRGADEALRTELEPIFVEHGVDVVFQAHQHLYARLRTQRGIRYFVTGAGGKRAESFRQDEHTFPREDRGSFNHFVFVRVTDDRFSYCVIDANGDFRDGGTFARGEATDRQVGYC